MIVFNVACQGHHRLDEYHCREEVDRHLAEYESSSSCCSSCPVLFQEEEPQERSWLVHLVVCHLVLEDEGFLSVASLDLLTLRSEGCQEECIELDLLPVFGVRRALNGLLSVGGLLWLWLSLF